MPQYSLEDLNRMNQAAFTAALGAVFEQTPEIAQESWHQRPFSSVAALHQAMVTVMCSLPVSAQLALIQAHPDLGGRAQMTAASIQEQAEAGLDQLSAAKYDQFHRLNQQYQARHKIPFILAVKGHTQDSILASLRQRLTQDVDTERQRALAEIGKIAKFRLEAWVTKSSKHDP